MLLIIQGAYLKLQNKIQHKKLELQLVLTPLITLLTIYLSLGHLINLNLSTYLYQEDNFLILVWIMILLDSVLFIINRDYFEKQIKLENKEIILNKIIGIGSVIGFIYSLIMVFLFLNRALSCNGIPLQKSILFRSLTHFESTGVILTIGNLIKQRYYNKRRII